MSAFLDLLRQFSQYSIDSPGAVEKEILTLELLASGQPAAKPNPVRKLVLVAVEARLIDKDIGPANYSVRDLVDRLDTYGVDLAEEGWDAVFVKMGLNESLNRKDGKMLLAMRELFKSVRDSYPNFEGAVLVGSFPQATIVRTWPQGPLVNGIGNTEYRVGQTMGALRPFDIVLADLDGNWRKMYYETAEIPGYIFEVMPDTTVNKVDHRVTLINPKITAKPRQAYDFFWICDARFNVFNPPDMTSKVELDQRCRNPEISPLGKQSPNPIAMPSISVSRIDARPVAVNPLEALLKNGKPTTVSNMPRIDFSGNAWACDEDLERTLLVEYFDRNHAFRIGKWAQLAPSIGLIEDGMGSVAANQGLDGLNLPREKKVMGATVLDLVRWLKQPVLFRAVSAHASNHFSLLDFDGANEVVDTALVEAECGGSPWRWIEDGDKCVPSFKGHAWDDPHVYRTLWENRVLAGVPPSLMLHASSDVGGFTHYPIEQEHPHNGLFQNACSMLFYANQLAIMCPIAVWSAGPSGFGSGFGKSPLAVMGDGWKQTFEHCALNADIASRHTERKGAYNWSVVGDWTLRKHY